MRLRYSGKVTVRREYSCEMRARRGCSGAVRVLRLVRVT